MCRSISGSLSIIMSTNRYDLCHYTELKREKDIHSSTFSTLFSIASAGLPYTALQICVCIAMRAGRRRISRLGAFNEDSAR